MHIIMGTHHGACTAQCLVAMDQIHGHEDGPGNRRAQ